MRKIKLILGPIKNINAVLIGNPNTGKSSVFNRLTGLNQSVGNYPGVTVDKKVGHFKLDKETKVSITDLPGTYSLNPNSIDENVVLDYVLNEDTRNQIDVALFITDIENIKRTLLLYTQLKDLKLPVVLVVNMADTMNKNGISLDVDLMKELVKTDVVLISSKTGLGFPELKEIIKNHKSIAKDRLLDLTRIDEELFKQFDVSHPYVDWLKLTKANQDNNETFLKKYNVENIEVRHFQQKEIVLRHKLINDIVSRTITKKEGMADFRKKLDSIFLHRIFGLVIFFGLLLLIFQAIYTWSATPMEWIETIFANFSAWTKSSMAPGMLNELISEGVIPGLGGVVIFIPQIAFLFLFIAVLEESGYMSRVVFITDKIMRKFGLSGKSIVPMISGTACAIPAVMATRNIENWKERLITILVTPFVTCAARLPVYLIIIALVIPTTSFMGISYQAITLLLLYILGFVVAIAAAFILNKSLKIKVKSDFVVEMPNYKLPLVRNVFRTVFDKTKSFVWDAGKIILAISVILWFLASNGYSDKFYNAESIVKEAHSTENLTEDELDKLVSSYKIENSYIGTFSKKLEPAIAPLGYDWKIGIALISSFAAREVFVGTLATIYSVGEDEQETIKNRMAKETKANGEPLYNFATGVSLLLFYAFALQCMSTIAVVRKETAGWKWPIIQLFGMTGFAYITALIAYQILK